MQNPEYQQWLVRVAFFFVGNGYIGICHYFEYYPISGLAFLIFAILFFLYVVINYWHVMRKPVHPYRSYLTLCIDVLAITFGIYVTGKTSSPLYIIYVWVFLSQAVRFGRRHLYLSAVLSQIGFVLIIFSSQFWLQQTLEASFLLLSLVVLPIYIDVMLKKLKRAEYEALEASRAKSVFLANMSHELRTPLNAIIGYSELLYEDAAQANQKQAQNDLMKIRTSGQHLLSLISNVLDLSKIEAGKIELEYNRVKVHDMIDGVVTTMRSLIEQNGNRFEIGFDENLPEMESDETKLKQILINLLGNAAKFTENGEISLKVSMDRSVDPARIIFDVMDTGIGISEDHEKTLFSPFSQADNSTTRKYGGTGLGLAISRTYCRMMGGDLVYSRRQDRGASFKVILPVRRISYENMSGDPSDHS